MEEEYYSLLPTVKFISYEVLLPIFVSVGLIANVFAFCVWVFGPKSKSMCCAIYFAANSAVDFILLTQPPLWNDGFRESDWLLDIQRTDVTCKLFYNLYWSCYLLSTCISAIVTVERSLTILFPFRFKCQDMRRRSKIVIVVIFILQPFIYSFSIYYMKSDYGWCTLTEEMLYVFYLTILFVYVSILMPFVVIIFFNVATVATLLRQRIKRNGVSGRGGHANAFTRLTIMTGISFVLSYTIMSVTKICELLEIEISDSLVVLGPLGHTMVFFNCLMNPVICFIVCKTTREDLKSFFRVISRKIRRTCMCTQQDVPTTDLNPGTRTLEDVYFSSGYTGSGDMSNTATMSIPRF